MAKENNGVNLQNIGELVSTVKGDSKFANARFAAKSRWLGGTQTEVTITEIKAGGETITRSDRNFKLVVDEPPQLGGSDEHPNPVEYLAAGLCGCITAGIATNAALFGTPLDGIEVEVEMDYDLRNVLGIDRNGPGEVTELRYKVRLSGTGAHENMIRSKETIDKKSPVRNTLQLPIKVVRTDVVVE
jgi:uncharacterized OsmC-like protein